MTFRRARSEEQRELRRETILGTAADMLKEMSVTDLSLNELSRRVGLAKSNVLRYFESREAVLLELLDRRWQEWLAALESTVDRSLPEGDPRARYEWWAGQLTEDLAADPLLCELVSVHAAVLEHNISTEVARGFKATAIAHHATLTRLTGRCLPELSDTGCFHFAAGVQVAVIALWPLTRPSAAMIRVYELEPELAVLRIDFATALREVLATLLAGSLARWPR